jgi:hypothetical protein
MIMDWIINNWYLIVGGIALLVGLGYVVCKFLGLPTKSQVEKIKEWLLYAVTECEAALGSQTGVLKLRMCYDMFVARFPFVAKIISFEKFSVWVDEALDKMKELLVKNDAVREIVVGYKG